MAGEDPDEPRVLDQDESSSENTSSEPSPAHQGDNIKKQCKSDLNAEIPCGKGDLTLQQPCVKETRSEIPSTESDRLSDNEEELTDVSETSEVSEHSSDVEEDNLTHTEKDNLADTSQVDLSHTDNQNLTHTGDHNSNNDTQNPCVRDNLSSKKPCSSDDNTSMPSQSDSNVSSQIPMDDLRAHLANTGLGFSFTKNVAALAAARSQNMPALNVQTFGDESDSDCSDGIITDEKG